MKKLLCLLAFLPMVANAGLYLEPYVGYSLGDVETTNGPKDDANGAVYGGRIGFTKLGLMLGYEYSKMDLTYERSAHDEDVDTTLHGIYLGYRFPRVIPIIDKIWATYDFSGESEYDHHDVDIDSGYSIGLGVSPIPVPLPYISLNVNLEYRHFETDKVAGIRDEVSSWLLSLSMPINF